MYTGVLRERQADGGYGDIQTQCLAVGDGVDYEKCEMNPVLDKADLPEGSSAHDFRDPKIWQKEDGTYCCVVGRRPADGSGQILLYTSPDGFEWKFKSILASNHNRFGKMWECPDFFRLDGKWVLLTSPQDMLPKGFEYHTGNGTLCLIGEYDEETGTFTEQYDQAIDYGIDFYATQTILSRRTTSGDDRLDAELGCMCDPFAGRKMAGADESSKRAFYKEQPALPASGQRAGRDAEE